MFVTNWISTTKIQKISEITNFFRHYFLSRTEVILERFRLLQKSYLKTTKEVFSVLFLIRPVIGLRFKLYHESYFS